jgi:hypothetical protein
MAGAEAHDFVRGAGGSGGGKATAGALDVKRDNVLWNHEHGFDYHSSMGQRTQSKNILVSVIFVNGKK